MKKKFVKDLKAGDSIFGEVFAVKGYKKGSTRNNKPFWDLILSDKTGMVRGKIWENELPNCEAVALGDVVSVTGTIEEFMNAPQVKVTHLKKTVEFDIVDLEETTSFDPNKMWKDLEEKIAEIKNPHLQALLKNIFTPSYIESFKKVPAAFKVHHNYKGGLLEHTWEMIKMAESFKRHYPKINMDLVNAGIILHDVGKIEELIPGTAITQTNRGKLLGHIYLGAEIIEKKAPEDMPQDLLDEIIHIVLAHIGIREFGSPAVPMTTEAMAVYVSDYASTRLRMAYDLLESDSGSELFTQYIPHLGTELYRSPYSEELSNEDVPF